MKKELGKKYDIAIEKDKYEYWLKNDCFTAGKDSTKTPFTVVIPVSTITILFCFLSFFSVFKAKAIKPKPKQ